MGKTVAVTDSTFDEVVLKSANSGTGGLLGYLVPALPDGGPDTGGADSGIFR